MDEHDDGHTFTFPRSDAGEGVAYSALMAHGTQLAIDEYEDLHAIVADALRYQLGDEALEEAAHEVLARLREHGLLIPSKPAV